MLTGTCTYSIYSHFLKDIHFLHSSYDIFSTIWCFCDFSFKYLHFVFIYNCNIISNEFLSSLKINKILMLFQIVVTQNCHRIPMLTELPKKRCHTLAQHSNALDGIFRQFESNKDLHHNSNYFTTLFIHWVHIVFLDDAQSTLEVIIYTAEPPNRGHFGTAAFVLSSEVVLFSEVVWYLPCIPPSMI